MHESAAHGASGSGSHQCGDRLHGALESTPAREGLAYSAAGCNARLVARACGQCVWADGVATEGYGLLSPAQVERSGSPRPGLAYWWKRCQLLATDPAAAGKLRIALDHAQPFYDCYYETI